MGRILVLTPRLPYPVVGGDKLRIHNICKELATRHELTLLSVCSSKRELTEPVDLQVFRQVHRVYLSPARSGIQAAAAMWGSTPMQVAYYRSPELARQVERLAAENDMVLAHLIRTGEYVRQLNMPKVLEMTDAISMNYRKMGAVKSDLLKSMVMRIEARGLYEYETKIVEDFDLSVVVSETDRKFLLGGVKAEARERLTVAPNGVDLGRLRTLPLAESGVVLFIGNQRSVQNQDACIYFAEEVMPRLRQSLPQIVFRVVGPVPEKLAKRLKAVPGVELTGEVASIPEAAAGAFCGVCPVRIGAGMQNKVLEYFALGVPAVVSPVGLEGLDARPEEHLLLADGPEATAAAVIRLHGDKKLREALALAGGKLVKGRYSWSRNLEPLINQIDRLLAGRALKAAAQ